MIVIFVYTFFRREMVWSWYQQWRYRRQLRSFRLGAIYCPKERSNGRLGSRMLDPFDRRNRPKSEVRHERKWQSDYRKTRGKIICLLDHLLLCLPNQMLSLWCLMLRTDWTVFLLREQLGFFTYPFQQTFSETLLYHINEKNLQNNYIFNSCVYNN